MQPQSITELPNAHNMLKIAFRGLGTIFKKFTSCTNFIYFFCREILGIMALDILWQDPVDLVP